MSESSTPKALGRRLFSPILAGATLRERMLACLGALIEIALTGMVCGYFFGQDPHLPLIVAPMGASAVLLFAVPASPLAQPWSIIGGNTISAMMGILAALFDAKREGRNVWARRGESGPCLLLNSHIDTVPAVEGWSADPWVPRIAGDRLVGLGASYAKASVAARTRVRSATSLATAISISTS